MSETPGPVSLPRSVRVPVKIPTVVNNEYLEQSPLSPSRYQYELNSDMFDPYSSSPPQKFMLKLKERLHAYDARVYEHTTSS